MRNANYNFLGLGDFGSNFTTSVGIVKNNADPAQCGRLQIFIPAIDTKNFKVEDLPWALYVSPFGGHTADFVVGRDGSKVSGGSSYGMWAIPKNGAQVLCGYLEGDPNVRFYMGCFFMPELNRTLPQSINEPPISTEIDESGQWPQKTIDHYDKNLSEAELGPDSPHWKTRGGFERSVSYPQNKTNDKPNTDGYFDKPLEKSKKDSQTISLTSPGRHYLSMHDVDEYCRMRFKTTEGTQIILDDTNERIYISTARGRNWIEIDEGSGKIYFYTAAKFNIHSENDLNLYSDSNINIVAKKRVNIQSEERAVKIQSKLNTEILSTDANVKIVASRDLHLKTTDGDQGDAVEESEQCNLPPYSGDPLGFVRDYEEEGGSETSKIFINSDAGLELRSDNSTVKITGRGSVELRSIDSGIKISGSQTLDLKSSAAGVNIQGRDLNLKGTSNVNVDTSNSINLKAGGDLRAQSGRTMHLKSSNKIHSDDAVKGPGPADGASGAATADAADQADPIEFDEIKVKMIVPLHDPWLRDEDEGECPTPRNPKYQG